MDALPVKPAPPHRPPARAPAAAAAAKRPARAPAEPPSPEDEQQHAAALAQQRAFDMVAAAQAEQLRDFNALRDLAMQQAKRDDSAMNAWIKLI